MTLNYLYAHPNLEEFDTAQRHNKINIIRVQNAQDARDQLEKNKEFFQGIFLYPFEQDINWVNIVKDVHLHQIGSPVYLIDSKARELPLNIDPIQFGIQEMFPENLSINKICLLYTSPSPRDS